MAAVPSFSDDNRFPDHEWLETRHNRSSTLLMLRSSMRDAHFQNITLLQFLHSPLYVQLHQYLLQRVRHTVRTPQQPVKHAQCPKARMGVSLTRFKLHWQALLDAIPRYLLGFFASLGFCSPAPATSPAPDIVSTINHRLKKSPYLSSRRFFPLAFSYWDDTTPRCVESARSC